MKNIFFIVVILGLILSGCSASFHVRKAKQKCPECFKLDTTINEVVIKKDTIIKIDTNITILLPRDTASIDTTIKKLKPYSFKPIYIENGIINVEVSMNFGNLIVNSWLDSTMVYRYQDSIRIKDAIIINLREVMINQNIIIKNQKGLIERLKSNKKTIVSVLIGLIVILIIGIIIKFIRWIKK